ncbi:hypothetical protein V9P87_31685, partial [Pseudomonas aeruginosa]
DYGVKLSISLLLFVTLYGMLLKGILKMLPGRPQSNACGSSRQSGGRAQRP